MNALQSHKAKRRKTMTKFGTAAFAAISAALMAGPATSATLVGDVVDVDYDYKFARIHYRCAAGKAVISAGMPVTTMIYRTSPAHRSAGEGMAFALSGNISGPWNAMTANRAANLCHEGSDPEFFDIGTTFSNI